MATGASLQGALCDAARIVAGVARGRSLSALLDRAYDEDGGLRTRAAPGSTRAALIDLTHGTLRAYGRVQAYTRALERDKRRQPDPLVEALLWCSIYALSSARHADYTVVDQAVRACGALERAPARGYVNAILRNYLRERPALEAKLSRQAEFRWQHPRWWIDALRAAWPTQWESMLAAGNAHPPMCLRVNRRRTHIESYLARLHDEGIRARAEGVDAILLEQPLPVERIPGFAAGEVSVQDAGAQHAARLLDAAPGMRVLDACAAPGGKCSHVLELADVALTALDVDAQRCTRIAQNLSRLGLQAEVRSADCIDVPAWWDGRPFDRILADVPCTGSGVTRRHPDIKWLRRPGDAARFAERQARILDALWQVLAPDGKLLYVTCSVFREENNAVVDAFCARNPAARELALPHGAASQLLPGPRHDGFYYALLGRGG